MDYEKEYKEALERAREWYNNPNSSGIGKAYLYAVFPELKAKENEDERIRKALINFFDDANKCEENPMYEYGIPTDDIISWLEKQDEKEQTNFPQFTFDDVLALQCVMETVKKVQEDKDLYNKLNDLHGKVYDAYQTEKQGEQHPTKEKAKANDKAMNIAKKNN